MDRQLLGAIWGVADHNVFKFPSAVEAFLYLHAQLAES